MEVCPGCKAQLPRHDGAPHPYFGASPSCWALYSEVLGREYSDPALMTLHRLTVDAYAVQHPGDPDRRAVQSVWAHLVGLYLTVERGSSHTFARKVIAALVRESDGLVWLVPPADLGRVTVVDVAAAGSPSAHLAIVRVWADVAWSAWYPHHSAIRTCADRITARL